MIDFVLSGFAALVEPSDAVCMLLHDEIPISVMRPALELLQTAHYPGEVTSHEQ